MDNKKRRMLVVGDKVRIKSTGQIGYVDADHYNYMASPTGNYLKEIYIEGHTYAMVYVTSDNPFERLTTYRPLKKPEWDGCFDWDNIEMVEPIAIHMKKD